MSRKPQSRAAATAQSPPVSMELALDNYDLLMHILLLLPAKSLIRFKSVCKKWLSLISSDHFCHQHTLRRPKLQRSLILELHSMQFFYFNRTTNGRKVTMIPYSMSVPSHEILQESNGLLLLKPEHQSCYAYNPTTKTMKRSPNYTFYVYNPTTRKSRTIAPTHNDKFPRVEAIGLAFDLSKSPYYKVVLVRSTQSLGSYRIEVYDSESHTWKLKLSWEPSSHSRIYDHKGIHCNNSIFWKCYEGFCYFDIAKNEIKTIPFTTPSYGKFYLQESHGHLYYFELVERHRSASVKVKVAEFGGDEFFSKHRGVIHVQEGLYQNIIPIRLMGEEGDGDGSKWSLLTYEDDRVQKGSDPDSRMTAYNFLDKSYEPLVDFTGEGVVTKWPRVVKAFQFGEVLALV